MMFAFRLLFVLILAAASLAPLGFPHDASVRAYEDARSRVASSYIHENLSAIKLRTP